MLQRFTRGHSRRALILNCEKLIHPNLTLDIDLIRDEANVVEPRKQVRVKVLPLGAGHTNIVEHAQGNDPIIPDETDNAPASSSHSASRSPRN